MLALTTTLEKQHASAQGTIRDLEDKVRSLEDLESGQIILHTYIEYVTT